MKKQKDIKRMIALMIAIYLALALVIALPVTVLQWYCGMTRSHSFAGYLSFRNCPSWDHDESMWPEITRKQFKECYIHSTLLDDICYLNCVYSADEYQSEVARIKRLHDNQHYAELSNSRLCDSVYLTDQFALEFSGYVIMYDTEYSTSPVEKIRCEYALFEPLENRIVYVRLWCIIDNAKEILKNFPESYLPAALTAACNAYVQGVSNT